MLEVIGPRLSTAVAERVASRLVDTMTRTRDSHQLARLAGGLRAVGAGLSAAMSEQAANWIVDVMTRDGDLDDLCRLAGGLEAIRPWLPEAAAARAFATLSGSRNAFAIVRIARNLEQVGPRLLAPDADRATERIVTAMSRISDRGAAGDPDARPGGGRAAAERVGHGPSRGAARDRTGANPRRRGYPGPGRRPVRDRRASRKRTSSGSSNGPSIG